MFSQFDPKNFDPSKMDPKILMELTQLIQQLPPDKLSHMQQLMHNMMAGFDVRAEMQAFEQSLPPGFRERIVQLAAANPTAFPQPQAQQPQQQAPATHATTDPMDLHQARMTILRGVADGHVTPEQAEKLLFG